MEYHERPWKVMECHGRSWNVMEGHGRLPLIYCSFLVRLHYSKYGKSWKVMEGHGMP